MEEEKLENKENELIERRREKFISFIKKKQLWVIILLAFALILGIYLRTLPMQDHSTGKIPGLLQFTLTPWKSFEGKPGLWDITTNTWTLGPDLDPWLFLRGAKSIVETGSLPEIDMMRNVPLGFETAKETRLLQYFIAGTYYLFKPIKPDVNIEFAGVVFPVIMFALTILSFFLFVREIFIRKDEESKIKANMIAIISAFFMIVTPVFLSRTIAGIPEKESAGFFFMFLSFYLFIKSWKTEKKKASFILAGLSGISTALMGLVWGGVSFIFVTIAVATFLAFILNKTGNKEFIIYTLWIVFSFLFTNLFSARFSIMGMIISLDSGLAFIVFFILLIDFALWKTKIKNIKILEKYKLPKNITSLIIALVLLIVVSSLFLGPSFIVSKLSDLNRMFITPVIGRWNITVAENRQPYFTEWAESFGPFIQKIPILFWLFFVGSVMLFKKMISKLNKKHVWILTLVYIIFFFGLVFSRYSGDSNFNGENLISKVVYFGAILLMVGSLVYYRIKFYEEDKKGFESIDYEFLLLFSLFALCLFSARSAVRLIMVLGPIAPIFVSFLVVESANSFRKSKDETLKIIFGALAILFIIMSIFIITTDYKSTKEQAYNFVPYYYNQQWQKAMQWVRDNTDENAVFGHWWDYGYWLQSIGNRATVTDGGNAIKWWNYMMGRYVLTGDNQQEALSFLKAHNTTHFLIDSTDIGKYTAFSSIGSNKDYDRYSWIPSMVLNKELTQETRDGEILIYQGGSPLDEDIFYEKDGKETSLPGGSAYIGGVSINTKSTNQTITFNQPEGIFVYQGQQVRIPIRYLYFKGKFVDFKEGINATVYIIAKIDQASQGYTKNEKGAAMYLSPRITRGLLGQIYILNDPFKNFPGFKSVHNESSLIVENFRSQWPELEEFVYLGGVQGPIKIWELEYTGKEEFKEEYIDTNPYNYIDWRL